MVTIETFIKILSNDKSPDLLNKAHIAGWIEDQDERFPDSPVDKRTAARIIHNYMIKVLGISDLTDISGAEVLKDLYTCHACVNHVAQVYLRGIMSAEEVEVNGETAVIFNMTRQLEENEITEICRNFMA